MPSKPTINLLIPASLLFLATTLVMPAGAENAPDPSGPDQPPVAAVARQAKSDYANLAELITMISDETAREFADFFGDTVVRVEPFPLLWEFADQRPSLLGITMADQMAAALNRHTRGWETLAVGTYSHRDQYGEPMDSEPPSQWLQGTMQEVNGYLRIHINGRNANGTRRSHVINAEMSGPIYRALHTIPASPRPEQRLTGNPG